MAEAEPELTEEHPIVLFDGVCNLCNGLVQFLLERDTEGTLRFGSLQSEAADELLDRFDVAADEIDSIVLVEGDEAYVKSAAVLRIAKHLGVPYSLAYAFRHVPRALRDWVYDQVAAHRYQVFGKRDQCMVPPPDVDQRFIEGSPTGSAD